MNKTNTLAITLTSFKDNSNFALNELVHELFDNNMIDLLGIYIEDPLVSTLDEQLHFILSTSFYETYAHGST